ncbi:unnamed protein product [Cylicocyclus nassatus]|uniref:Uncharacterized protein n=1 Tax=Cylicocyclus nassatus TaxID=53992 RepID=A0AA36GMP0_CYLNA|nr:unnamed protein product [Cylicocyclus nassatus]
MFYTLVLILVVLQVAAATAPNRTAVMADLLNLDGYSARVAELRAYREYKLQKKAAKEYAKQKEKKKTECKSPTNGTYTVKIECRTKIRISVVVKSKEKLRKPYTNGPDRVKPPSVKGKDVVECRNPYCCGECSKDFKTHTGKWYQCYSLCAKSYPKENKNYRQVAEAA